MPAYKTLDEKGRVKSWFSSCYYRDWKGERHRKVKRGFPTRAAALEWERDFIDKQAGNPSMLFSSLVARYLEDFIHRVRPTTYENAQRIIKLSILPTFENVPIDKISPAAVREWENSLLSRTPPLSQTTLKVYCRRLSAILNFAVKFYGLPYNPLTRAGSIGKSENHIAYWTPQQFTRFITSGLPPKYIALFCLLFWTGCRRGEALALTPADIDFNKREMSINKTRSHVTGRGDVITPPKTPTSVRKVALPPFLCMILQDWIERAGIESNQELFEMGIRTVRNAMENYTKKAGLPHIRVHDLRHSHASMLINMGISPKLIQERLGHKSISTTLDVYSHFYKDRQADIIDALQDVNKTYNLQKAVSNEYQDKK